MSGRYKAVPTGTIANGKPVIVNSTGTVSQVSGSATSVGTAVVFESAVVEALGMGATFDSNSNRIVIAYQDTGNSYYGTAIVGTIDSSDNSVSFGSPVVFHSVSSNYIAAVFDSNSNKVVISFTSDGGKSYVGTVDPSDNSISFGSVVAFQSDAHTAFISSAFDSNSNKVGIFWKDQGDTYGTGIVGTVSGTSISYGSEAKFESAETNDISATFDSSNNKVVIAYRDVGNSHYGTAIVGTISSTSISYGSPVVFESATTTSCRASFDTNSNKVFIAYDDHGGSTQNAIIGTVSGTGVSFGTAVAYETGVSTGNILATGFDSNTNKVVVGYGDSGDSNKGKIIVGSISGTSVSFETPVEFDAGATVPGYCEIPFDSSTNRLLLPYKDGDNSQYGTGIVIQTSATNLSASTSEGYIGLSNACSFHGATETYTVTVASGVFYLNGLANPPIQLLRGHTYIFDQADGTNDGHPFHFKDTGGSQYTSGVTVTGTAGTSGAKVTIVVPIDATEPSQYYCTVHGNGMGNVITIEESFAEVDVVGTVNKHQSGLTAGQTYFVQTDGTLGTSADDPSVVAGTAISATEIIVKG